MLSYNEIRPKTHIVLDKEPYEVVSSNVFRKQKRKPVNQTKLKHLITGKVTERSFHHSDTVEEADIDTREIKYLYNNKGEWWFSDPNDLKDRFSLEESVVGTGREFLKENTIVEALTFEKDIIGVKIPIKVTLVVKNAPPNIKGNTSQGGTKRVVLETGAEIDTPLFVNAGDLIEINTETGTYSGRTG